MANDESKPATGSGPFAEFLAKARATRGDAADTISDLMQAKLSQAYAYTEFMKLTPPAPVEPVEPGIIIIPKPGQLLAELGADDTLMEAAKSVEHAHVHEAKWKKAVYGAIDWSTPDEPGIGGITKQGVKDAVDIMTKNALKQEPALVSPLDMKVAKGPGMDIAFWYYRETTLIYSIRRVKDNFFYDFATKRFAILPTAPRAGMPNRERCKLSGFLYSTRLSGKLDDDEYVVTCRDTNANDVVIGIMALFMKNGVQGSSPQQGLEDTPIEEGIPPPEDTYALAETQRVRSIDTD